MAYYPNPKNMGIIEAISEGDGYTINISWNQAYLSNPHFQLAYHIYYSTDVDKVFEEGPKFISFDGYVKTDIFEFTPGQLYHFAVRAVEIDPTIINLNDLPTAFNGLAVYPESLLSSNISASDGYVPLLDVSTFPPEGIVKVGVELIEYLSINTSLNKLNVPTGSGTLAFLVDQGGGHFYTASATNIGDGYINNLTLGSGRIALTETWTIKCVFVEGDGYARFSAEGSLSGVLRDGYGNPYIWNTDNAIISNGILSFSVSQGLTQFALGDYFIVKVLAATNPYDIGRGFYGTSPRIHNTDGYDGYYIWNPTVIFWAGQEEPNTVIVPVQSHFEFTQNAYTIPDGYKQITTDILTTDLSASDASNIDFNSYDYAGWHRTDPTLLLNGECVGSYIGGQQYCADGYSGVGLQLRGLSFQERMNQREEMMLTIDSEPMVLLQRQWTGIVCNCYMASGEYPDDRCPKCFPPNTLVRTENGLLTIKNIKVGDRVLSSDGSYQKVKQVIVSPYDGYLHSIYSTTNTNPILCTPDHPFMVLRGSHNMKIPCSPNSGCKAFIMRGDGLNRPADIQLTAQKTYSTRITNQSGKRVYLGTFKTQEMAMNIIQQYKQSYFIAGHLLDWDDAKNINERDWLVSKWPNKINDIDSLEIPQEFRKNTKLGMQRKGSIKFKLDEEFLWVMGLYLAEGSSNKRTLQFALHKKEIEYQNRIINFFKNYGYNAKTYNRGKNGICVEIYSTSLAQWFSSMFGKGCANKKIPEFLMNLPTNKLWSLLSGIYDGDGVKRGHEIIQTSEILALQLTEILHKCGYQALIRQQKSNTLTPNGNKRKIAYCVSWEEDTFNHHNRIGRWDFNGELLSRVKKSNTDTYYCGNVYNLEVEGDHTYVVQNIVVHNCYGTKYVIGWNQYFNPRISDGRIMVRADAADDVVKQYEAGLESEHFLDCWTLSVPTIKQRDVLVRFTQDDQQEFRYEVISVRRNRTLDRNSGGQHFRLQRIRKSDPAYQIPVFYNTQFFPQTITTGIGMLAGVPHTHTLVISENFPNGTHQLTSTAQGHNHAWTMINGVLTISEVLGHSHSVIVSPLNPSDQYIIR